MPKNKNAVWRFFASVKLALAILIVLASTSIIGTLVKQGKAPAYYIDEYGVSLARLFETMSITNMYHSWWFITLLCLFALNLVICSIKRLPGVWSTVAADNLCINTEQLEKMSFTHRTDTGLVISDSAERVLQCLTSAGWKKPQQLEGEGFTLLFAQHGAWTRFGVYVVHISILIILTGAIAGSLFGFQAYVFLPEGRSTNNIFLRENKQPFPLGFELQCDRFEKSFYPNGMIKQYRADLTVLDQNLKEPYKKSIIVNDPLTYKGLSFYVGDSFPLEEFFIQIRNQTSGMQQAFRVPTERDVPWQGTDVSFRVEELTRDQDGAVMKAKIRFASKTTDEPTIFWVKDKETVTIGTPGEDFTLSFRQLHSTLLLITKDPGILIVYCGFILMIIGLSISFFLSHRRIWAHITPQDKNRTHILLSGTSNKHRLAFEQSFEKLVTEIAQVEPLTTPKKKNPRK
jgi:cytochrome c biogenesis protein